MSPWRRNPPPSPGEAARIWTALGGDPFTSDMKREYRRLSFLHHPDRGGSTARFQDLQAAYGVLRHRGGAAAPRGPATCANGAHWWFASGPPGCVWTETCRRCYETQRHETHRWRGTKCSLCGEKREEPWLRRTRGGSPYFGGGARRYGHYQWNIKYYGWQSEEEIEDAQRWAFGDYDYSAGTFENIEDIVGRRVKSRTDGRSAGWFVIDEPLTRAELRKVDRYIALVMKDLPKFLEEERRRCAEERAAEDDAG